MSGHPSRCMDKFAKMVFQKYVETITFRPGSLIKIAGWDIIFFSTIITQ
jgi:hypothetical protein